MFSKVEEFILDYQREFAEAYAKPLRNSSAQEQFEILVRLISEDASVIGTESKARFQQNNQKKVYYFSMEFLIGRLLKNYLSNLGVLDIVRDGLKDLGIDLEDLFSLEPDPGLGNGGLGRLAACFLDSMATLGVAGTGMGVRYRYGLFRQKIHMGFQQELPDAWLERGYPWENPKTAEYMQVHFGGEVQRRLENGELILQHTGYQTIAAIPYDIPIIGYGGETVNTLRLWHAQPLHEQFDMDAFNRGDYAAAFRDKAETDAITTMLYPDDSTPAGQALRLKQEYFLVAAGVGRIVRDYLSEFGPEWDKFADRISIHTNDTHPALCAPELMRIFMDEHGMSWVEAWDIVCRTCSYTNHTILPEALERWPVDLMRSLLPRIYLIVEEIDRRYRENFDRTLPNWRDALAKTSILSDGQVHMANLSVICSYSVNGVASLHTEILKESVLHDFYTLRPEIFNNKTNGVSHRRFLIDSNPGLAGLISEAIGDGWIRKPEKLQDLIPLENDSALLEKLAAVKRENKVRLSNFIGRTMEIDVDPDSVFDVQVKRIHAYKRQLLAAFKILDLYNQMLTNPSVSVPPYTFIFAGKAAAGYALAKEIIKFVCSVADLVNADPRVNEKIKVIFVENFCVSNAQLIYPAADISEQISTAGKEASGTGNMKFMFNGAVTLGTLDGANVEIRDLVGDDNIFIFGLTADQTMSMRANQTYHPHEVASADPRLSTMVNQLVNGFFSSTGYEFWQIYDSLLRDGDEFFVLADFEDYVNTWNRMNRIYGSKEWNRISLHNISKAGYFSSDRTIAEYCTDIWHTSCQF
ncbi:MAG: glycogen/starch/alpha-glucan phosphorylase [Oscillospiraceae bacterium]|nr:glycogen/starch/alpha-glucan phosphorylase [Oscillospiraceae bacterium]